MDARGPNTAGIADTARSIPGARFLRNAACRGGGCLPVLLGVLRLAGLLCCSDSAGLSVCAAQGGADSSGQEPESAAWILAAVARADYLVRWKSHAERRMQALNHFSIIDLLMLTTNNSRLCTMAEWQDISPQPTPGSRLFALSTLRDLPLLFSKWPRRASNSAWLGFWYRMTAVM